MMRVLLSAVAAAGLCVTACSKPAVPEGPAPKPAASAAPVGWTPTTGADATLATAAMSMPLDGGFKADLMLGCSHTSAGYTLSLKLALKDAAGAAAALPPAAIDHGSAYLKSVRSTGEDGSMMVNVEPDGALTYKNDQTNGLDTKNDDPAKVELAQKIELPLPDSRKVWLDLHTHDAGFDKTLAACKALP